MHPPRFSQLHHQSRLLKEKAAEPFFDCLEEIARSRPMAALLENVIGLLKVWDKVGKAIGRLRQFGYKMAKVSFHHFSKFYPQILKQCWNKLYWGLW